WFSNIENGNARACAEVVMSVLLPPKNHLNFQLTGLESLLIIDPFVLSASILQTWESVSNFVTDPMFTVCGEDFESPEANTVLSSVTSMILIVLFATLPDCENPNEKFLLPDITVPTSIGELCPVIENDE